MNYEFTISFALPNGEADPKHYLDALFEAGCDDALVGIGQAGLLSLDFDREATDAVEAVCSAIADVRKAIPEADIVEVSPDLVSMTGIARVLGCSRQNIRKHALSGKTFPKPVHAGDSISLWHLVEVVAWAQEVDSFRGKLEKTLLELAAVTCKTNLELQLARQRKLSSSILGEKGQQPLCGSLKNDDCLA